MSVDGGADKPWHSALKRNHSLIHATAQMNSENVLLGGERCVKFRETELNGAAQGLEEGAWGVCNGHTEFVWDDEHILGDEWW